MESFVSTGEGRSEKDQRAEARPGASPSWPPLPLAQWQETYATLHLWTQIVGKTRLSLSPMMNHWWQVTLYVTARGLTTSPMPSGFRSLEIELDFIDHALVFRTSDGMVRSLALASRPVAEFYADYMTTLRDLGVSARFYPVPVELPAVIPFRDDCVHATYDPEAASRYFRALVQVDRVFKQFRGRFSGKCSPVHFWWGAFDLACTRFSGRRAPAHPGGVPNTPDYVQQIAYSHECISAGWWPGSGPVAEPAFYAYAYPEPQGLPDARIEPAGATYNRELREFIMPYEAVRTAEQPDDVLLDFLESTYVAAADLAGWDRASFDATSARLHH